MKRRKLRAAARLFLPVLAFCIAGAAAAASRAVEVPLPLPRPAPKAQPDAEVPVAAPQPDPGPSACEIRLRALADFAPMPPLEGPGECGATDVVALKSVRVPAGASVAILPAATLRCPMAEVLANFVRQDAVPASAESLGGTLQAILAYETYECRGRNRVIGAKVSEHGRANAIDIRAFRLTSGAIAGLTDPLVERAFRERVKVAACAHFTTVLGPGSDGYHESHVHLDLAERRGGYRLCQWDVREPPVLVDGVPLPPPRPAVPGEPPQAPPR